MPKRVSKIIVHPGWDKLERQNDIFKGHDIALLVMKGEADMFNRKTIPICLPYPERDRYLIEKERTADIQALVKKILLKMEQSHIQ